MFLAKDKTLGIVKISRIVSKMDANGQSAASHLKSF